MESLKNMLLHPFFRYIATLILGLGVGYYMSPDVKKEEDSSLTSKKEYKIETKQFDPQGKLKSQTTQTGQKTTQIDTSKSETEKTQKQFAVKGGASMPLRDNSAITPRFGMETRMPFFNTWLGAEIDGSIASPRLGSYLRMEF